MDGSLRKRTRWLAAAAVGLGAALVIGHAVAQQGTRTPETGTRQLRARERESIDPQATEVVRRMADYLTSLGSFRVTADSATELVLRSGEKIQVLATSNVAVRRPNGLRSERHGPLADTTFIYDGRTMTIYGQRQNLYAQTQAPPTLDEAIDFARDRLGIEAPGADLLYADLYEGLMDGVTSGRYLGPVEVDGVVADHVAFRSEDVDFQLWVERGDRPLPLRYVIVTKDQQAKPEFIVRLHDWDVAPRIAANELAFTPPEGAVRIQFLDANARAAAQRSLESRQEGAGA